MMAAAVAATTSTWQAWQPLRPWWKTTTTHGYEDSRRALPHDAVDHGNQVYIVGDWSAEKAGGTLGGHARRGPAEWVQVLGLAEG